MAIMVSLIVLCIYVSAEIRFSDNLSYPFADLTRFIIKGQSKTEKISEDW